jgi:predicted AlkP superfamily phosphohydrolase/phosphomutase
MNSFIMGRGRIEAEELGNGSGDSMSGRVIVLGLDGATFSLIDPFIEAGYLPNLSKMMREGNRNVLKSTIPPATVPAWPSFYTGKNPGKHGVFDFFTNEGSGRRIVYSRDVKVPAIWEMLSLMGKRSIVLNVPTTYPPRPINGVIASGMLTRSDHGYVQPGYYQEIFDEIAGGYRVNEDESLAKRSEWDALFQDTLLVSRKQWKVFLALLRSEEWDFAMWVARAPDVVQHQFWCEKERIIEVYQEMDHYIGKLLELYPEVLKITMSDHGAMIQDRNFHVNSWLRKQGYLKIKIGQRTVEETQAEIDKLLLFSEKSTPNHGKTGKPVKRGRGVLRKFRRVLPLRDRLYRFVPEAARRVIEESPRLSRYASMGGSWRVDWDRTRAHGLFLYGTEVKSIHINLRGREPGGVVPQKDYEPLRTEIITKMRGLRCPVTGQPVVREIHRREEIYTGPYLEKAPDILYLTGDGLNIDNRLTPRRIVTRRPKPKGCHHPDGIFITHGPAVNPAKKFSQPFTMLDLAPTILYALGLPIDAGMDGKILKQIFHPAKKLAPARTTDYALAKKIGRLRP